MSDRNVFDAEARFAQARDRADMNLARKAVVARARLIATPKPLPATPLGNRAA